jgi:putative YhdH/YhfP family quinone oxidoreductase
VRAYVVRAHGDDVVSGVEETSSEAPGEVLVRVGRSALNFKDHLVARPRSRVRRTDRLILGVEAAGEVIDSSDPSVPVGSLVITYGGDIGVGRDGGFAELIRVPSRYVNVLDPTRLDARRAMVYGLAGYSAMASVLALEAHGASPGDGEVLVTGATGGVGSLAVTLAARRGHRVTAATGSARHAAWLASLGAAAVIGRDEIADRPDRVLATERWAGAIDCVGGTTLAEILRSLRYGAAVAASGLVGGSDLVSTVYPFITRAVSLVGIDAVEAPTTRREQVWDEIARAWREDDERLVERELTLDQIGEGVDAIGHGATRGRWLVNPGSRG